MFGEPENLRISVALQLESAATIQFSLYRLTSTYGLELISSVLNVSTKLEREFVDFESNANGFFVLFAKENVLHYAPR